MAKHGIHRRLLAELAANGAVEVPGASLVTPVKAGKMLEDDSAHGRKLTPKQRGLFGLIHDGGTPSRARGFRG